MPHSVRDFQLFPLEKNFLEILVQGADFIGGKRGRMSLGLLPHQTVQDLKQTIGLGAQCGNAHITRAGRKNTGDMRDGRDLQLGQRRRVERMFGHD